MPGLQPPAATLLLGALMKMTRDAYLGPSFSIVSLLGIEKRVSWSFWEFSVQNFLSFSSLDLDGVRSWLQLSWALRECSPQRVKASHFVM